MFHLSISKEPFRKNRRALIISHAFPGHRPLKIPWERSVCVLAAGAEDNQRKDLRQLRRRFRGYKFVNT